MYEIYNQKCANINVASPRIQANEKWLVYGTGASSGLRLSVAAGATVTLNVTGKDYNPAIGAPGGSCGDIIIESTVHLTATAGADVSKAITTNGGRHRPPSLSKPPETPTFRLESGRYETGNLNYELKNQEKLRLSIRISYLFTYHISNISLIHL